MSIDGNEAERDARNGRLCRCALFPSAYSQSPYSHSMVPGGLEVMS